MKTHLSSRHNPLAHDTNNLILVHISNFKTEKFPRTVVEIFSTVTFGGLADVYGLVCEANYMEKSLSREDINLSPNQELPRFLRNPKVH
jgi:hypothetical protein